MSWWQEKEEDGSGWLMVDDCRQETWPYEDLRNSGKRSTGPALTQSRTTALSLPLPLPLRSSRAGHAAHYQLRFLLLLLHATA